MPRLVVNPDRAIGAVRRQVFGSFVENLERCIYGGIHDPGSRFAGADGMRGDVLAAARRLGVSNVRFPGGCFAPFYHWRDGVGPAERRPRTRYRQPRPGSALESWPASNAVGTDEFVRWCRALGAEPFICVNMGSGTPEEARDWVEYCNLPAGTRWADLRAANGSVDPHGVRLWALGNEISGKWEFGHAGDAADYVRRAREYARVMKLCDPDIRLVLAGSHFPLDHRQRDWNRQVLEDLYDYADWISIHHYVGLMGKARVHADDGAEDWRALGPVGTHRRLGEAMLELEQAFRMVREDIELTHYRKGRRKEIGIAVDEYGPWYRTWKADHDERFSLGDALAMGGYFNAFIRNADVVTLANQAQLVNVLGLIIAEAPDRPCFVQATGHVPALFLPNLGATAVDVWSDAPSEPGRFYPRVPLLDASATLAADGTLTLNLVNRDAERELELDVQVLGRRVGEISGSWLGGAALDAVNDAANPERVAPRAWAAAGSAPLRLPPASVAVLRLR